MFSLGKSANPESALIDLSTVVPVFQEKMVDGFKKLVNSFGQVMEKSLKAKICAEEWGLSVMTTAGTALYKASLHRYACGKLFFAQSVASMEEAVNIILASDVFEIEPKVMEQILLTKNSRSQSPLPLAWYGNEDPVPLPSERSGGHKTDDCAASDQKNAADWSLSGGHTETEKVKEVVNDEEPAKTEKGKKVEDDKEPALTEPRKEVKDDEEPDVKEEEDKEIVIWSESSVT